MALELTKFDAAEYLKDDDMLAEYLSGALETADSAYISHALGVVARAKGMTQLAEATGLSRESLYRALSDKGNPEFATVLKVMAALGLRLSVAPIS